MTAGSLVGYEPDPALEDATWQPIVCVCKTVIGLLSPDGRLVRYRCIDRRCKLPGKARLSYIDLTADPPTEIAHTHVAVKVALREGHGHGQ